MRNIEIVLFELLFTYAMLPFILSKGKPHPIYKIPTIWSI